MDVPTGTRIAERYVIERALAKGGMGSVYVAVDERLRSKVALKITAAAGAAADVFQARFGREARIGNLLGRSSPFFVRAFDWGRVDTVQLYLVMDLVEGARPLDLRTGSREERLVRWRTAAGLVALAHEKRVVHRDLKPANFLQTQDGTIFLTDFGLAKVLGDNEGIDEIPAESLTMSGIGFGTPPYMPPEQFEDSKNVDERADVYALGCMLFEALTGRLPYPGPSPTEVMRAQVKAQAGRIEQPRPRRLDSSVSEELDSACRRALELEVDQRIPSVRLLLSEAARDWTAAEVQSVGPLPTCAPDGSLTGHSEQGDDGFSPRTIFEMRSIDLDDEETGGSLDELEAVLSASADESTPDDDDEHIDIDDEETGGTLGELETLLGDER